MTGRAAARSGLVLALLASLLLLASLGALKMGQVDVSWPAILDALTGGDGQDLTARRVILGLRLPRVLLGVAVGASLAVAGVVFQAVLRNPLADPYLLGISGGASLGAAAVILGGAAWKGSALVLPAAAFLGALAALLAVMRISGLSGSPGPTTLILAGVMVSAFCSALVMLLSSLSPSSRVHGTLLWMMGSLASPAPGIVAPVILVTVAGGLMLALSGHHLNALSFGEATARQVGVDLERVRWRLLGGAALVTAAAVAASGLIGFIGLVVPHALRSMIGADNRLLLPSAALAGGAALVLADGGARMLVPPAEVPVGVITALFGAPFFLALLIRGRRWMR